MLNKILNYDLHDEETLKADGFDEAIIGITNNQILVYSIEKMIDILMKQEELSEIDAIEYLSYNVFGNYVGDYTPIYVYTTREEE